MIGYSIQLILWLVRRAAEEKSRKPARGNWGGETILVSSLFLFLFRPVSARRLSRFLFCGLTNSRRKIGTALRLLTTEAKKCHTLSFPRCRFHVVAVLQRVIFKLSTKKKKKKILTAVLLIYNVHFHVVASTSLLPRFRFHAVAIRNLPGFQPTLRTCESDNVEATTWKWKRGNGKRGVHIINQYNCNQNLCWEFRYNPPV